MGVDVRRLLSPILAYESVDIEEAVQPEPMHIRGHEGPATLTWYFESFEVALVCRHLLQSPSSPFNVAGVEAAAAEATGPIDATVHKTPSLVELGDEVFGTSERRLFEALSTQDLTQEVLRSLQEKERLNDTDEDEAPGRRLNGVNCSMLYGLNLGVKSNGILIGKQWIFNAMDVMKGLFLGIALASAKGVDWVWDSVMNWIQSHLPGDNWHVKTVGSIFKGLSVQKPKEFLELLSIDVCGMIESVLLYFDLGWIPPCWLSVTILVIVLIIPLYIYIRCQLWLCMLGSPIAWCLRCYKCFACSCLCGIARELDNEADSDAEKNLQDGQQSSDANLAGGSSGHLAGSSSNYRVNPYETDDPSGDLAGSSSNYRVNPYETDDHMAGGSSNDRKHLSATRTKSSEWLDGSSTCDIRW